MSNNSQLQNPGSNYDQLFSMIETLVMHHSPSGAEQEIDQFLLEQCRQLGVEVWQDEAGNVVAKLPGKASSGKANPEPDQPEPDQINPSHRKAIAITAHKDEIGGIVKAIEPDGRVIVRKLGGAFPWVYGEGVVDLLGDGHTISGILSFGSRHVSHESPQKAQQEHKPLLWEHAWVETKRSVADLVAAGIRPGTRMVVGKHRKRPFRMGDYIASYTLDNKASVAILLELVARVKQPMVDTYLVASAKEEVGAIGALYFANRVRLNALIALEICPLSPEYPIQDGDVPVLLSQDGYGLYDEDLNAALRQVGDRQKIPLQLATISGFGSDGSIAMKFGHVPRAACLSFPTQNTHGYEIAHLGAIDHCIKLLVEYLEGG